MGMMPDMEDAAERDWLTAFLRERDESCPLCAVPLRGVGTGVCPGCGRELVLTLKVADPYVRAWVTAALAMCLSAGVGVLVFAIVMKVGLPGDGQRLLYWVVWYFMLTVPVAAVVVLTRRRFMRLKRNVQRRLAIAAVLATVLGFLSFLLGFLRE